MQDKKQQLELDMEQWTGSKSGKEYIKAAYCYPDYLLSGKSHGQRSLAGYSPWGRKIRTWLSD